MTTSLHFGNILGTLFNCVTIPFLLYDVLHFLPNLLILYSYVPLYMGYGGVLFALYSTVIVYKVNNVVEIIVLG